MQASILVEFGVGIGFSRGVELLALRVWRLGRCASWCDVQASCKNGGCACGQDFGQVSRFRNSWCLETGFKHGFRKTRRINPAHEGVGI